MTPDTGVRNNPTHSSDTCNCSVIVVLSARRCQKTKKHKVTTLLGVTDSYGVSYATRRHCRYSCCCRLCHRTIAVALATAIIVATTYVKTVAAATDASAAAIVAAFSTAAFS